MLFGEGCCALTLCKGASVNHWGTLAGFVTNSTSPMLAFGSADANKMSICAADALSDAHLQSQDVCFTHGHFTGSPSSDVPELTGIIDAIAYARGVPLVLAGHKANIGHTGYAAGIVALIASVLMLHHKQVPVQANVPDPIHLVSSTPSILLPNIQVSNLPSGVLFSSISGTSASGDNVHLVLKSCSHKKRTALLQEVVDQHHAVGNVLIAQGNQQATPGLVTPKHEPMVLVALADGMEESILAYISSLIGRTITATEPLMQAGLKSNQAIEVSRALPALLNLEIQALPPTLIFNHPSVHAIVIYLKKRIQNQPRVDTNGLCTSANTGRLNSTLHDTSSCVTVAAVDCIAPCGAMPEFFSALCTDTRTTSVPPLSRCNPESHQEGLLKLPGHFLKGAQLFDYQLFSMSPSEVRVTDPNQRVLLEAAMNVLVSARFSRQSLFEAEIAVFLGFGQTAWQAIQQTMPQSAFSGHGVLASAAAGRVSYTLGLRGPALVVDTACSASLVALDTAQNTLRMGRCEHALTAGVALHPHISSWIWTGPPLAPDGQSKTFDASANGYGRGEGCFAVVLEQSNCEHQLYGSKNGATVKVTNSAVNQDGRSSNFSAPSGISQSLVIRSACDQITFLQALETHGTGTALGDPIEMEAIQNVLAERSVTCPLVAGALKTQIGHTEFAAGMYW